MVAVHGRRGRVAPAWSGSATPSALAAVNGPKSVVVSGHADAVDEILAELSAARRLAPAARRLARLPLAPHGAMVDEFAAAVTEVELRRPAIPFVSTVTGEREQDAVQDPDYWRRHVADTVRFADAVAALRCMGVTDFLEVGPQPTLLGMVGRLDAGARLHPSLRNGRADDEQVAETLGSLWTAGIEPDWTRSATGPRRGAVDLPTYPFQRVRLAGCRRRGRRRCRGRVACTRSCTGASRRPPSPATCTRRRSPPPTRRSSGTTGCWARPSCRPRLTSRPPWPPVSDAFGPGSRQLEQVQLEQALLLPDGAATPGAGRAAAGGRRARALRRPRPRRRRVAPPRDRLGAPGGPGSDA